MTGLSNLYSRSWISAWREWAKAKPLEPAWHQWGKKVFRAGFRAGVRSARMEFRQDVETLVAQLTISQNTSRQLLEQIYAQPYVDPIEASNRALDAWSDPCPKSYQSTNSRVAIQNTQPTCGV